jgi:CRISPR-associated protein Cmr2
MASDWDDLLLSWMHDPPGKALDIRGHETHSAGLASIALGREVHRSQLHTESRTEDILASRLERVVPLPKAGENGERAVRPVENKLTIVHPLSGCAQQLDVGQLNRETERSTLEAIVAKLDPPRARAFAVWRLWRERLMNHDNAWGFLPADTRLPDHTIWHHLDVAMGCRGSTQQRGVALLSFSLGPVQPFIAAARTVRDLWAGSYILSWLTFSAMEPILEQYGPGAILSPALRGNPQLDRWLRALCFSESPDAPQLLASRIDPPKPRQLLSPCLPNRFTAFVPMGVDGQSAKEIAEKCEQRCRNAWKEIADAVLQHLRQAVERKRVPLPEGWDRDWHAQIGSFFELRTAVLPLNDCNDETIGRLVSATGKWEDAFADAARVRQLTAAIPHGDAPGYGQDSAGHWMGMMDLLGRLMAAQRSAKHVPDYTPQADAEGKWPGKCSLMGTYEAMGPGDREAAGDFWEAFAQATIIEGARVRKGERLCALSLVKRYAWAAYFRPELSLKSDDLSYPDTATVAANVWLEKHDLARIAKRTDWSGQWLHWGRPNQEADEDSVPREVWESIRTAKRKEAPPAYYAILMMDGDNLGKWLRGDLGPTVSQALAPQMTTYFNKADGLAARRPIGPAFQAALSEALTNFALHFVPDIIEKHHGTLIYAGGDDVLALLPTQTAVACAQELNQTYQQNEGEKDGRRYLLMGNKATVSAGLAIVHYKEDLRVALQAARVAEKQAKTAGRNALCLRVVRRSGEDSSVVMKWNQSNNVHLLIDSFLGGASDRWAYKLRALMPTLEGLPQGAFEAEMTRQLNHSEGVTQEFRLLIQTLRDEHFQTWCGSNAAIIRNDFITLVQSASFMARGRDQ